MRSGGRMELMPPPSRAPLLLPASGCQKTPGQSAPGRRVRFSDSARLLLNQSRASRSADLRDGANRAGIAYLVTIQWISDDCSARARVSASCLWAAARSQSAVRSGSGRPASTGCRCPRHARRPPRPLGAGLRRRHPRRSRDRGLTTDKGRPTGSPAGRPFGVFSPPPAPVATGPP